MAKKKYNLNNLVSFKVNNLKGSIVASPDKSISHRSLLFASLSIGLSRISNLLEADDILRMIEALKNLGVKIRRNNKKEWLINGVGLVGFDTPSKEIDCGNSGTLARILIGALANNKISVTLIGDKSLNNRPMDRVMLPLKKMGVEFITLNNKLPITINGKNNLIPIKYNTPVSSAQIKTSILLASLNIRGVTEVIEPYTSRNHSENLLKYFGADIKFDSANKGKNKVLVQGGNFLKCRDVKVPGDISSAAFSIVAACIVSKSLVKIMNVGVNIFRIGIIDALKLMGANIVLDNYRINEYDEPVSDIIVSYARLKPIKLKSKFSSKMIDEYPILAMAAAATNGKSIFCGLSELKYKESDRFKAIMDGLNKCGIMTVSKGNDLIIYGNKNKIEGGVSIDCQYDHRIAMSFLILGTISKKPIEVIGCKSILTSYPNFYEQMNAIGLDIRVKK